MEIVYLTNDTKKYNTQAANLLSQAFPQSYADCAADEVTKCLEPDRVAIAAVDNGTLRGFVGAMPQYGITAWELHPLVVDEGCRGNGIGTLLCSELERILRERGVLTIYLGSDDENGSTSLANTDLFMDTFEKIGSIQNFKRHPYEFYQRVGYQIVGVIPNANGIGKPDIWLAKSIV